MNPSAYSALAVLKTAMEIQEVQSRSPVYEGVGRLIRIAGKENAFCEFSIALCRMLFEAKSGSKMRHPFCGEPRLIGESDVADWPLFPIHIHQNVPFLVVMGWTVAGRQETGSDYLAYCLCECVWRNQAVSNSNDPKQAAEHLVEFGDWRRPLTSEEEAFLLSQTTPIAGA